MSPKSVQRSCAYPALPPPVDVPLVVLPKHSCPYLPGRVAEDRAVWASAIPEDIYQRFMDAGFRRSGRLVYQPSCRGCRECLSIRVPVAEFRPDKSQRRCSRANGDLAITRHAPQFTAEKYDLYAKYLREWHGKAEPDSAEALEAFLYDSPLDSTLEFEYRDREDKLVAVGITDVCPASLSSVYFYFDPAHKKRGLGTFGALHELSFAAANGLPYYYLGYWVKNCGAMTYKQSFRPNEVLEHDGIWRRMNA